MNRIFQRYENYLPAGILFLSAILIAFFVALNTTETLTGLICLLTVPVLGYVLFFNRKLCIPILVFLIPLSVNSEIGGGAQTDFPAEPLLGIFVLVMLVYWLLHPKISRSVLKHPLTILIFLELMWMIVCSANGELPLVSFKRCIVRFSYIVVFYILFSQWFENLKNGLRLFLIYASGCLIPVLHTLYYHALCDFSAISAYLMPRPFFPEHTIYGACLAFLLPMLLMIVFHAKEFAIRGVNYFGLLLLAILISTGEFLSYSRAAWISLGVALLFRIFIFFRIRFWIILLLLFFGGMIVYKNYNPILELIKRTESTSNKGDISEHILSVTNLQSDVSNLERINRWKCAIRMAEKKPLTGFGPGTYQFVYGSFQSQADMTRISTFRGTNGHAHSEIFNSLSEEGIPGMLIYVVLMFSVIGYGLKIIYRPLEKKERLIAIGALLGLVTYYVHGFFNAFLDTEKMAALVFGSIAILVHLNVEQKKRMRLLQIEKKNLLPTDEK